MKGHTNNPNGRPKGKPNKVSTDLKTTIKKIVENQFEFIEKDLKAMDSKDRINTVLKLTEYILPKQRETRIDLSNLSDDEVDDLIQKVISKQNSDEK
ncbi:MAG: hypothetical protein ACOVOQ_14710 [Flavobacterium sp.]